jgi:6-phosphogluconolactonase
MINVALAAQQRVLWLLPGGSSIAIAAAAYQLITPAHLDRLTMTLTDERYGEPGHPDSNWTQLAAAGIPVLRNARALPVLTGISRDETVARFDALLREQYAQADVVIGMFGMGTDGHTAGILPGTPAVTATAWAAGYKGADFERITMTFPAIQAVHAAILGAYGPSKLPMLELLASEQALPDQPAQVLKTLPSLVVFSDSFGESL